MKIIDVADNHGLNIAVITLVQPFFMLPGVFPASVYQFFNTGAIGHNFYIFLQYYPFSNLMPNKDQPSNIQEG